MLWGKKKDSKKRFRSVDRKAKVEEPPTRLLSKLSNYDYLFRYCNNSKQTGFIQWFSGPETHWISVVQLSKTVPSAFCMHTSLEKSKLRVWTWKIGQEEAKIAFWRKRRRKRWNQWTPSQFVIKIRSFCKFRVFQWLCSSPCKFSLNIWPILICNWVLSMAYLFYDPRFGIIEKWS